MFTDPSVTRSFPYYLNAHLITAQTKLRWQTSWPRTATSLCCRIREVDTNLGATFIRFEMKARMDTTPSNGLPHSVGQMERWECLADRMSERLKCWRQWQYLLIWSRSFLMSQRRSITMDGPTKVEH